MINRYGAFWWCTYELGALICAAPDTILLSSKAAGVARLHGCTAGCTSNRGSLSILNRLWAQNSAFWRKANVARLYFGSQSGGILNDVQGGQKYQVAGKDGERGERKPSSGNRPSRQQLAGKDGERGERKPSSGNRPSGQQLAGKDGERGERTLSSGNRPSGQQLAGKDGERGERKPSSGNRPSGQQLAGKDGERGERKPSCENRPSGQ